MAFIDTSVLVAYLCPEPLQARATRMLNSVSIRVITPLIQTEVASALSMKVRTGQLDLASAKAVLDEFQRLFDGGVFVIREITSADYKKAFTWLAAFSTPLRAADAVHAACAFSNRETLFTADTVLDKSAKILGVSCRLLK